MSYRDEVLADHPAVYFPLQDGSASGTPINLGDTEFANQAFGDPSITVATRPKLLDADLRSMSLTTAVVTGSGGEFAGGPLVTFGPFDVTNTNGYTIELWCRFPSAHDGTGRHMLASFDSVLTITNAESIDQEQTGIRVVAREDVTALEMFSSFDGSQQSLTEFTAPGLVDGRIHHVAFVFDADPGTGNERGTFYVDGQQAARAVSTIHPQGFGNRTWQGGVFGGAGFASVPPDATASNVALYPSALSPERLRVHIGAGLPPSARIDGVATVNPNMPSTRIAGVGTASPHMPSVRIDGVATVTLPAAAATDRMEDAPDLSIDGSLDSGVNPWDNDAATVIEGKDTAPGGHGATGVWFRLTVAGRGVVTVSHDPTFEGDTYLYLYRGPFDATDVSQLQLVSVDDDSAGNLHARIRATVNPGQYWVLNAGKNGVPVGEQQLVWSAPPVPVAPPALRPSPLATARGVAQVRAAAVGTVTTDGRSHVAVIPRFITALPGFQRRTYPITVVSMPEAATNDGQPNVPLFWAHLASTLHTAVKIGPADIHVVPPPPPNVASLPFPPTNPARSRPPDPDGRWVVADLPSPGDDYYWLGSPDRRDGTGHIARGARQWSPHSSTPSAPDWRSAYPFKPSVTAVNHYLQGGGIVHHPKGVNFNSHFIEHMWLSFGGSGPRQPITWVVACAVASWPSEHYEHTILDYGLSPAANGIHYRDTDCNRDRKIHEHDDYRSRLAVTRNRLITSGDFTHNLRGRAAPRRVPTMYFSVLNGSKSIQGEWRRGQRATHGGDTGSSHSGRKHVILGRRAGILSRAHASHVLVFEIRFFNRALSRDELEDQYDHLSHSYHFGKYS